VLLFHIEHNGLYQVLMSLSATNRVGHLVSSQNFYCSYLHAHQAVHAQWHPDSHHFTRHLYTLLRLCSPSWGKVYTYQHEGV